MEILSIINIVIIKMQQWGCVCVCMSVYPFFKLMCGFRYFGGSIFVSQIFTKHIL